MDVNPDCGFARIKKSAEETNSLLCLGLDPSESSLNIFFTTHAHLPRSKTIAEDAESFCRYLIAKTKDLVCCYKPNSAFFEAFGPEGFQALKNVCDYISFLNIPIILDGKRGDIGNTARAYAKSAFDIFNATIVTVNPYMGLDSLLPFIESPYCHKGIFVLCCTSNPGSKDVQQKRVILTETLGTSDVVPISCNLYEAVAGLCKNAGGFSRAMGLVIGANLPDALKQIRSHDPEVWFLCPGVGAQGADMERCVEVGLRDDGYGLIIPISRGIAEAQNPRQAAEMYRLEINKIRFRSLDEC